MAKPRGTKRLRTADMPIDKETPTHVAKKPKPKHTRMTEWGNLLPREPENQAPRAHTESSLSSLHESNLDDPSPAQSIVDTQDLESLKTTPEEITPPEKSDQPHSSTQDTSLNIIQPAAANNLGVTMDLAPAPITKGIDFAKYPLYAYSNHTGRARHGWIWNHGYDIQHQFLLKKSGKPMRRWVCKICHEKRSTRKHDWEDSTTTHMRSHMAMHGISREGKVIVKPEPGLLEKHMPKGTLTKLWSTSKPFPVNEFKALFLKWVICDNITLRQSVSQNLRDMFALLDSSAIEVLPTSHNTTRQWITSSFIQEKNTVRALIKSSGSRVSISFDVWSSDTGLSLLGVVAHFLTGEVFELKTLLLGLPVISNNSGTEQARVLLVLLKEYGIDHDKLGWFVLDNTTNNDTALEELSKSIPFDPREKRLRCAGHMINLAAHAFLYGQDSSKLESQLRQDQSDVSRLELWRESGPVGKLHNLVFHITRSARRTAIFAECQEDHLPLADHDKIYSSVRDGGVRWNSTYMMIERAIKLRDSIDQYCLKLTRSADEADKNAKLDELSSADWEILVKIKSILKLFFITTKHLEGNAIDGSHGALWEAVLGIECLIQSLEEQHTRLKNDIGTIHLTASVALALDKLEDYLGKTNRSAVWLAAIVLHPKHKWVSITTLWGRRNKISLLNASKIQVQNMWAGFYQDKILIPEKDVSQHDSYMDSDGEDDPFHGLLNTRTIRTDPDVGVVDEYVKYINKDRDEDVRNPLQWWRDHQSTYPNLAQMAFDLFAIPAMSSECERSFSKASNNISARRSNLSNDIVESGEALRSWVSAYVVKLGALSSSSSDMT